MGKPKALLEIGGETFLQRILRAFRDGGVDHTVLVLGGPHAVEISDAVKGWFEAGSSVTGGLREFLNLEPEEGPISSLRVGLRAPGADESDAFLVHPVDIPMVSAEDVRSLLRAMEERSEADVIIPSHEMRRAHPVLLRTSAASRALALGSGKTLRDLWRDPRVTIHHLETLNPWLRRDVDTPEDFARLRDDFERDSGSQ